MAAMANVKNGSGGTPDPGGTGPSTKKPVAERGEQAQTPAAQTASDAARSGARRSAPLTRAEARDLAQRLGFKPVKDTPFNAHGQPAFRQGNRYISPDRDVHSGGTWKLFDNRGNRLGTYNESLTIRVGD